jgi:universal stress protein A
LATYPQRLVLAVDRSEESEYACDVAGTISAGNGAGILLIHVKLLSPMLYGDAVSPADREQIEVEGREFLDDRRERVESVGGIVTDTRLLLGKRADETIIHAAEEHGADLLIIGGRGEGRLSRALLLGDTAESIVKHAPCSVLVARPPEHAHL